MDRSRRSRKNPGPPLASRLRAWLRPPRTLRPTRAGWIFFGLTFCVGFAAMNTGNNLLYLVLAFMLAFLVLSGVMSESALRGVSVRRRLPRELFAGAAAPLALEILNSQSRVPAFALVVEDLAAGDGDRGLGAPVGRVFALRVGAGDSELRTYALTAPARGIFTLAGFRVSTRFPFGLFSKALLIEHTDAVLVYPAVDTAGVRAPRDSGIESGENAPAQRGSGTEATGLRDYVSGDSHRHIHWRASLRRRELLVRELEADRRAEIEVRVGSGGASGAGLEHALSRAASEVVAFLDEGLRVALASDGARFESGEGPQHRTRLLSYLARFEPGEAAP